MLGHAQYLTLLICQRGHIDASRCENRRYLVPPRDLKCNHLGIQRAQPYVVLTFELTTRKYDS